MSDTPSVSPASAAHPELAPPGAFPATDVAVGGGAATAAAPATPALLVTIAPEGTLPGRDLVDTDRDYLVHEGIAGAFIDERAAEGLLRSVTDPTDPLPTGFDYDWLTPEHRPGILFGSRDHTGAITWLLRPWNPHQDKGKYVGALGVPGWGMHAESSDGPVFVVEGTKQALAAAAALHGDPTSPDELAAATVIGINGCNGYSADGVILPGLVKVCRGRQVTVILDGDAARNRRVYDAGEDLKEALNGVAEKIEFIWLPGRGTEGLDDLLATVDEVDRRRRLTDLHDARHPKPAKRRPSDKTGHGVGGFDAWDPLTGKLRMQEFAEHLLNAHHYSLTVSEQLAAYVGGRYVVAKHQLAADVLGIMGNTFTTAHLANVRAATEALAHSTDRRLPEFTDEPLANFRNGLVNLRTLKFTPHRPEYRTTRQLPVDWDPNAPDDLWVAWATERMGAYQLQVLEEVLSQMLDPSQPPSKSGELFGPKRTGKSTIARIMAALAGGRRFVSGVPIQSLSNPRFAAMLFQKVLNVCADLPREAIADESGFLKMLGGDPIMADEKYGHTFDFMNTALHFFATNTIPSVAGDTGAFLDRIVPLAMVKSFGDKANPAIEAALMEQLPGICVRLVYAAHARYQRAAQNAAEAAAGVPEAQRTKIWTPPHPAVAQRFADASDRVQRFVNTCCRTGVDRAPEAETANVHPFIGFTPGPATKTQLFEAFSAWTETEKAPAMGMRSFTERLLKLPGVRQIRLADKSRAINVEIKPKEEWEGIGDDTDLLPLLFPEEYGGEPAETPAPMTVPTLIPAPVPAPAPETSAAHPFTAEQVAALQMLAPATIAMLGAAATVADGSVGHTVIEKVAPEVLLTDLAPTVAMGADRLRALIRRLDPLLQQAGWLIRERRLRKPGVLTSAAAPEFGEDDFETDRVGYSVVRTPTALDPHRMAVPAVTQ